MGSIPASTGQPIGCGLSCSVARDVGLSPRVRGSPVDAVVLGIKSLGSIPASTGQPLTIWTDYPQAYGWVYPREYGAAVPTSILPPAARQPVYPREYGAAPWVAGKWRFGISGSIPASTGQPAAAALDVDPPN